MAKSIYGAADSTLVNMAYRASMANVPLNNAAIFAQREQNLRDFTLAVGKFMDNQWQDHRATEKERLELAQAGEEILLSGGNVNDFYLNIHNDTVLDYKRRNDAIKQDGSLDRESRERARQRLEIEMGKYKNSLDQEQEVMTTLLNNSANDRIFTDVGSPEAKAWNSILKDLVDGTNNSNRTIENGEIMYTVNGEKISLRDIKKGLSAHDPEFNTQFQTKLNNIVGNFVQVQKLGAEIKQDDLVRMKKSLFTGVTSMDQIRNLANTPFGKENHSFEEIFHAQAKASGPGDHEMINTTAIETIHNELDRLGGVDMDGDGDVDEKDKKDYRNAENAVKLIEEIKKDKFLYRDLVVGHIMETAVKDVYSVGMMQRVDAHRLKAEEAAARKGKSGKSGSSLFPPNQTFTGGVTGAQLNNIIEKLESGQINLGDKAYNVNPNNNSWTSQDGEDVMTGNDMLKAIHDAQGGYKFYNDSRFSKFQGREKKEKELVTSTTIDDVQKNIKDFFTDLNMLDAEGNYVPQKASGLDKILGGADTRMGKNRIELKNKINELLKQAGVEGKVATTKVTAPNSITLDGKQYTFKEGDFDYESLLNDLNDILTKAGVSKQSKAQELINQYTNVNE